MMQKYFPFLFPLVCLCINISISFNNSFCMALCYWRKYYEIPSCTRQRRLIFYIVSTADHLLIIP